MKALDSITPIGFGRRVVSLTAAALLGTATLTASPHAAFAQSDSSVIINEFQQMFAWMEQIGLITADIAALMDTEVMAAAYAGMDAGDVGALRKAGTDLQAIKSALMPGIRRRVAALDPPERWNIDTSLFDREEKALYDAAQEQYAGLQETLKLVDQVTDDMIEMLVGFDKLNEDQILELANTQIEAGATLIRLENQQLLGYLPALPVESPNHQFHRIMIQTNKVTLEEIGMPMDGSIPRRQAVARKMAEHLEPVDGLIRTGIRNLETQLAEAASYVSDTSLSAEERDFVRNLIPALEKFSDQFEVERQIYETMKDSIRLYESGKPDEDIQAETDANDLRYFRLIDRRIAVSTERISLAQ